MESSPQAEAGAPAAAPLIQLEHVTKIYPRKRGGDVRALNDLSLSIPAGDIHGIVGQSGAGKSTLIRCLTALERPTSGTITVAGQNLAQLPQHQLREARRRIGMVFQAANLLDSRTAAGNIAYPLYLAGVPRGQRHQRVEELLELVGLSDRASSYPAQLSGGQRQRVGIARALADEPKVLLCDEPTSALDSESTAQILELIRSLRDRLGVTVIIITHEMAVVRDICDSVTMLEGGQIVQTGRVEDIIRQPETQLARDLIPLPLVETIPVINGKRAKLIDICFTSQPGEPTGSKVVSLVTEIGADIAGGTFETIGRTQVGRLALAVDPQQVDLALTRLAQAEINAEVRADA